MGIRPANRYAYVCTPLSPQGEEFYDALAINLLMLCRHPYFGGELVGSLGKTRSRSCM